MKRLKQGAAALTGVLLLLSGCSGGVDEYQCVHPETGTLVQQLVEGTGTVSYREEYSVIPTVSAKILSCSIEEGDTVTAGQVLYVLDSGALEDQITQARLSLNSAQASYAQAVDACTDLTVPAHASGTVTEVYVHVGDYVNTGTAIASLVDSANLTLTVPLRGGGRGGHGPGQYRGDHLSGTGRYRHWDGRTGVRHVYGILRRPRGASMWSFPSAIRARC